MKKTYFTLTALFITVLSFGQGLGDFIFTGYTSDAPDQISFITLVDLTAGKEISFSDNGWFAAGGFRTNEGIRVWTVPAGGVAAGEEIMLDIGAGTASVGAISGSGNAPNLSSSGDQIFIYHTDNVPDSNVNQSGFIAAINMDTADWGTDATSSNNSALPSIFTNGTNAFSLPEVDNGVYNCAIGTSPQTGAALRASIYNASNWTTTNNAGSTTLLTCGLVLPVERNEIENFTVYPNPVVDGRLTINTMSNGIKAVQIFDVLGKQVFATDMQANGAVNVEALNSGIYILKVIEEGKTSTSRLLIE